jgi:hypothetical protein
MRNLITLAALATVASLSMTSAFAASNNVCLTTYQIDRTKIVDDSTIIFYMNNGKAWQNTLKHKCSGLKNANGFSYTSQADTICSNLQIIKLVDSGTRCGLGEFTPFTPPVSGPLSN